MPLFEGGNAYNCTYIKQAHKSFATQRMVRIFKILKPHDEIVAMLKFLSEKIGDWHTHTCIAHSDSLPYSYVASQSNLVWDIVKRMDSQFSELNESERIMLTHESSISLTFDGRRDLITSFSLSQQQQ